MSNYFIVKNIETNEIVDEYSDEIKQWVRVAPTILDTGSFVIDSDGNLYMIDPCGYYDCLPDKYKAVKV